jgi:hypothetical protein
MKKAKSAAAKSGVPYVVGVLKELRDIVIPDIGRHHTSFPSLLLSYHTITCVLYQAMSLCICYMCCVLRVML